VTLLRTLEGAASTTGSRWARDGDLRQAAEQILVPAVWLGSIALAGYTLWAFLFSGHAPIGSDLRPMWVAARVSEPYGTAPGELGAFLYSPVVVLLARELAAIPWPVFLGAWMVAEAVAMWWLTAPLRWRWRGPLLLTVGVSSVLLTNVMPVLCVCFVLAVTQTRARWVAPLALTKITPALAAGLWWAARGEWAPAIRALAVTLLVAAASFLLAPGLWVDWIRFLVEHRGDSPLRLVRLALGAAVTVWAGRTKRWWLLGVGFYLLGPVGIYELQVLGRLIVIIRLVEHGRRLAEDAREDVVTAAGGAAQSEQAAALAAEPR
jgi:hypothetical protein